jgi:tetratricopeptide (TPR) repeat protein
MRSLNPIGKGRINPGKGLILVVLAGVLTGSGLVTAALGQNADPIAASAPLDTLRVVEPVLTRPDIRYEGGDLEISRKVLPDIQATTVPLDRTPDKTPRLDDPMAGAWRFHLARQAASAGNLGLASQNLKQAVKAAPAHSRYSWWQTTQAVKGLDTATLFQVLPASVRTVIDSPVSRGQALVRVHQAGLLATGIFWSLLVAALYLGWWPHLAHDLGALFVKDRRHTLRRKLPLLLPLALLLLRPGWLGFLGLMSVPLLIQTRGKVRALLAVTWLCAVALTFPSWPFLQDAVPTIDPGSEVTLLEQSSTLPPSQTLIAQLNTRLDQSQNAARSIRLQTALAIQEARRGRFAQSDRLFQTILAQNPNHFPAMVGMANNTYYQGRLDQAATAYKNAAAAHPSRGEVSYNLAQVYFKKLFVPEATEALERARSLGFKAATLSEENVRRDGYAPVFYPALTATEMAAACRFEAPNYSPLVTISSWGHLLGAPPAPLYLLLGAPLLLAALLIWKWSRQNDPRCCENCGIPVCISCSRVRDSAWLCPGCGETADRARSELILGTLLKNRSRTEGMAYTASIVRLGRLVPGAGHLATGHFLAGWTRLAVLSAGAFLMVAGWTFDLGAAWSSPGLLVPGEAIHPVWLPLPLALWGGWQSLPLMAGEILLVLGLLTGLLDGPGLRRGIPERYSMAPQIEIKSPKTNPEAGVDPGQSRVHVMSRTR